MDAESTRVSTPTVARASTWRRWLLRYEVLLLAVLVVEWLLFYHFGTTTNRRGVTVGFGTLDRQFDILRHSCEIGLLALALTPVILTGGIDLSVGSLLGLCAVVFGGLTHVMGLPLPVAAAHTRRGGSGARRPGRPRPERRPSPGTRGRSEGTRACGSAAGPAALPWGWVGQGGGFRLRVTGSPLLALPGVEAAQPMGRERERERSSARVTGGARGRLVGRARALHTAVRLCPARQPPR